MFMTALQEDECKDATWNWERGVVDGLQLLNFDAKKLKQVEEL